MSSASRSCTHVTCLIEGSETDGRVVHEKAAAGAEACLQEPAAVPV